MLFERFSNLADGSIIRRVEEQLELTTWEAVDDRCRRRVLRKWSTPTDRPSSRNETAALSARQRATYDESHKSTGALAMEWLLW